MDKCKCKRCGHVWFKRIKGDPVLCPFCKNPGWNKKRNEKLQPDNSKDSIKRKSITEIVGGFDAKVS